MSKEKEFPKVIQNLEDMNPLVPVHSYQVSSYCPEQNAMGKLTEVHLCFRVWGINLEFDLVFKSPEKLADLIETLKHHGDMVWPKDA